MKSRGGSHESGDSIDVLASLPPDSVDAVVTDPPYGIGFMGHEWDQPGVDAKPNGRPAPPFTRRAGIDGDHRTSRERAGSMEAGSYDLSPAAMRAFQDWTARWATEVLRVLKPGGHLVSFASPRTNHRHVCGLEDAGFEIRDSLMWLFGEGFPKSRNLDGDWQGWGTGLKPAHEPITLARAPLAHRSMSANVEDLGTGALHIDACRIETEGMRRTRERRTEDRDAPQTMTDNGRWPANVVVDELAAAAIDEHSGVLTSGANPTRRNSDKFRDAYGDFKGQQECTPARGTDVGGASRFFYCAKASRGERDAGLDHLAAQALRSASNDFGSLHGEHALVRNPHPTVKPIELMRWLVRLITPPAGVVLDPFMGSGSTGIAARLEERAFVGIDRQDDYVRLAEHRIRHWEPQGWQDDLFQAAIA